MFIDIQFVANNLLVQKLWPLTFLCMSVDVKQSSDTSNFVAPKLARWYILFFAQPFGMSMGRVASQFLAKVIDWFGHNRDFCVRGRGQHAPWAYKTAKQKKSWYHRASLGATKFDMSVGRFKFKRSYQLQLYYINRTVCMYVCILCRTYVWNL